MPTREIIQLVSLATYANVKLQGGDVDLEQSITEYCYNLEFIKQPPEGIASKPQVIASSADDWFIYLKVSDVKRVKLHYRIANQFGLPDHITTAFVGGGSQWFIEVLYENKSDLYSSGQRDISKPWKTQFILLERDLDSFEDSLISVRDARDRLNEVLENLVSFSSKFEYTQNWAENFKRSKKTLTEYEPVESDNFIPIGVYSLEARRLLETSFRSWVFGGMGSWNDLAFSGDNQEKYTSLTKELYDAICNGIVSAVNSYP
jgi:hypothetical protein